MKSIKEHRSGISRRDFIKKSSSAAFGAAIMAPMSAKNGFSFPGKNQPEKTGMKCTDIADYFKGIGNWVDWNKTTDTFKAGDSSKPVKRVAVAWKASWDALREAVSRGADLFISHESICVKAVNGSTEPEVVFALPSEKPKFDWIEKPSMDPVLDLLHHKPVVD